MSLPCLRHWTVASKGMLWQSQSFGAVGAAGEGDCVAADEVGCLTMLFVVAGRELITLMTLCGVGRQNSRDGRYTLLAGTNATITAVPLFFTHPHSHISRASFHCTITLASN